jgi:hypothetical protein
MDTETLLEVTETEALHIVLCANAEVLGVDDDDRPAMVDAAMRAAEEAADGKLWGPDTSRTFSDWRGGTYSKSNLGYGDCYISLRRRDVTAPAAGGEEAEYGDWEWASDERSSPTAKALAEKIADAANAAFAKVKDQLDREQEAVEAEAEKDAKDAEAEEV